ncbi:MAG: DNA-binding protein [Geobacteraceae bacterium]|nr:DNA-binding protein [Geobacteraceae bacterium]
MIQLIRVFSICFVLAIMIISNTVWAAQETTQSVPAKRSEIPLSGKVLETMDGGGYTYILLKSASEQIWVALPLMKVAVGQELTLVPGFEMKNFTSKGLNRKFDKVVFSAGLASNQGVALSPQALKMVHQGSSPEGSKQADVNQSAAVSPKVDGKIDTTVSVKKATVDIKAASRNVKVARAKGRNAYTIAELYAKKRALEKKTVVVRGTVVKVTPRIMQRTWIHIQDGSGSAKAKTSDLILTTTDKNLPNAGDVVTVNGTLYNKIDFGSGYRYDLIIQGARLSR